MQKNETLYNIYKNKTNLLIIRICGEKEKNLSFGIGCIAELMEVQKFGITCKDF